MTASVKALHGKLRIPSDGGIHLPLLNAINDTSKASAVSVKRLINLGYSEEEAKSMTGFKGEYSKILKKNPFHDGKGRFTTRDKAVSVTNPKTPEEEASLVNSILRSIPPPEVERSNDLKQPGVTDLDTLYEKAKKGQEEYIELLGKVAKGPPPARTMHIGDAADYNKVLDDFASGSKGPVVLSVALKGSERLLQKVKDEYNGDFSAVGDVVRGTIAVDTLFDVDEALSALKASNVSLARNPKNRFEKPTPAGYRDIMLNVTLPSGHIAELQVNTKAMFLAKDKGHKLYERERVLEPLISSGKASAKEQKEYTDLQSQQKAIYEAAWLESLGGKIKKGYLSVMKEDAERYYIFDGMIPAKTVAVKFKDIAGYAHIPHLYKGNGKWDVLNNPESWDMNAVPATKAECVKLIKAYDIKKTNLDKPA